MKLSHLLLVAAFFLLVGCQNPKAANNENFGKAISAYLIHQEEIGAYCVGPKVDHFQVEEATGPDLPIQGLLKVGFLQITSQQPTMSSPRVQISFDVKSPVRSRTKAMTTASAAPAIGPAM